MNFVISLADRGPRCRMFRFFYLKAVTLSCLKQGRCLCTGGKNVELIQMTILNFIAKNNRSIVLKC